MSCYVCEDIRVIACMKRVGNSTFSLLKVLLHMNFNSLVIRQKQLNKPKHIYEDCVSKLNCKIEFSVLDNRH